MTRLGNHLFPPEPEYIPQAPRRETGLAEPTASAIYASRQGLHSFPYWAERHVANPSVYKKHSLSQYFTYLASARC